MTNSKTLMVFDFDHTVVNGNTDIEVKNLHAEPLPEEVKKLYDDNLGWTNYMGAIFDLLHRTGVTSDDIKNEIGKISLTPGMKELFEHLKSDYYETIIVSDANTQFIEWLVTKHDLAERVHRIYSNPAKFDEEDKLTIEYYHHQDWCDMSSENMCKGHILETHVKEREAQGVVFSRICYVGDGGNDYCPTLRLSSNDYVFPRTGYRLERKIKASSQVKANVVFWESGQTILDTLRSLNAN